MVSVCTSAGAHSVLGRTPVAETTKSQSTILPVVRRSDRGNEDEGEASSCTHSSATSAHSSSDRSNEDDGAAAVAGASLESLMASSAAAAVVAAAAAFAFAARSRSITYLGMFVSMNNWLSHMGPSATPVDAAVAGLDWPATAAEEEAAASEEPATAGAPRSTVFT